MKVLVTRVSKAQVRNQGKVLSAIKKGLVVFIGIGKDDTASVITDAVEKIINLRIFEGIDGKMRYSLVDQKYQVLCISNFTLCASTNKGRRPSFEKAMLPDKANDLFDCFVTLLKLKSIEVKSGIFGKHMDIDLELDGPVNICLDINSDI